jgi:hypothetical protein
MCPRTTLQTTFDSPTRKYEAHIVDVRWDGFKCHWLYYDLVKERLKRHYPTRGKELDIVLSPEMVCVGDFRKEEYKPCPNQSKVGRTSQCRVCSKTLIEHQECIFEPRCHGKECESRICREEHAVYLAFYGSSPKVGMTLRPRLRTRLIEQGADAYSLVNTLPDRLTAREFERGVSKQFNVPERIHPGRVLGMMKKELNEEMVREEYLAIKGKLKKNRNLKIGRLEWLRDYPLEVIRSKPRKRDTPGRHKGSIVGLKGKYLIYEHDGVNALNMNQLAGRFASF